MCRVSLGEWDASLQAGQRYAAAFCWMASSSRWLAGPEACASDAVVAASTSECIVDPCPFCLLHVSHTATVEEAASAFRDEHARFCSTGLNPWAYCIRCVAWNHILTMRRMFANPPEPMLTELGVWGQRVPDVPLVGPHIPDNVLPDMTAAVTFAGVQCLQPQSGSGATSSSVAGRAPQPYRAKTCESQQQYRWQFWAGKKQKWADYDEVSQNILNTAVQQRMSEVVLKCEGYTYHIDLTRMVQTAETGVEREIRQHRT